MFGYNNIKASNRLRYSKYSPEEVIKMAPLPPETLPTVPYVAFGVFNMAIPNIIAVAVVVIVFFAAAWRRLPKIF
jgi:hypothetical protein